MARITTTLTKFVKFLKGLEDGTVNDKVYDKFVKILRKSLDQNVFGHMQHEGNVFEIPTQSDLEMLIMAGGRSHKPGQPREAHYSKEYLKLKRKMGKPAHEYKQRGFVDGTEVNKVGERVVMKVPPEKVTRHTDGHFYGHYHEARKSVLKYAFLSAWEELINEMVESYKSELA